MPRDDDMIGDGFILTMIDEL